MSSERCLLLTGASGLLGRAVHTAFKAQGWNVVPLAFSRAREGMVKVDLRNTEELSDVVSRAKPSFIIHSAAQRFPDKVDKEFEATVQLNVKATENLAAIAGKHNVPMLYISTDYVFDGKTPPHKVDDAPNPLNKYGETKLQGEKAALTANEGNLVLRIPVLYGPVEYLEESAVTCLLNSLLNKDKPQEVSDYEIRYPSHVDDIAAICHQLAEKQLADASSVAGIFQWCGQEPLTKYGMIVAMAQVFNLAYDHLKPDPKPSPGASRPHNSQLDVSKLRELGIGHHMPFSEGIKVCLEKWVK